MYAYTNINFTDKQKEDPTKLYDILVSSGLVSKVINIIPVAEYNEKYPETYYPDCSGNRNHLMLRLQGEADSCRRSSGPSVRSCG